MKRGMLLAALLGLCLGTAAQNLRESRSLDAGWRFALGNAASPERDYGRGTEYFNYLTKAASMHNEGPYSQKFDASGWQAVDLPHDWAVDLPFAPEASHSHGYKTIGYKYPETSVGWYRKTFALSPADAGKHYALRFDGIFRDATVWVNGFLVGQEASGYLPHVYDVTDLLRYDGSDNLVCVRADATFEEGWFYEGAGIYRHVWLDVSHPLHIAPFGTFVHADLQPPYAEARLTVEATVENHTDKECAYTLRHSLIDADGNVLPLQAGGQATDTLLPQASSVMRGSFKVERPHLWSTDAPYLYTVRTEVVSNGLVTDCYDTPFGFRHVVFDPDRGLLLNDSPIKIKGLNMHQDHAGVGAAIPDSLQAWRLRQLKKLGANAYRCSHNPPTPEVLDLCDRMGFLVIDENRLMGTNEAQLGQLRRLIRRDRNHPSVILWSIGNEEWALEGTEAGYRVAETMAQVANRLDPSRLTTGANAGGNRMLNAFEVVGYNYLAQNPIDRYRLEHPRRTALGSEETSGCGTRGVYFDDRSRGRMQALNRGLEPGVPNVIERGWKFYAERPWLAGLFYWTGFDYRGEPNPLSFPATGSSFGILDYCGFPKDEAYYLQAQWTDETVLHLFPHWNLEGHEGDTVQVWAYTNCDEVELFVNGRSQGRQKLQPYSHLAWPVVYRPGKLRAVGYRNGRRAIEKKIETTGKPQKLLVEADRTALLPGNRDVAVLTLRATDGKGRHVPDAGCEIEIQAEGPARIIGTGNGDSAFNSPERPANPEDRHFKLRLFNGYAQVLIQRTQAGGDIRVKASATGLESAEVLLH